MSTSNKACPVCGRQFGDGALFCPKDGAALISLQSSAPADPFLGQELPGNVEIRALVGTGAMGRVYRAYQSGIDRDVAVKVVHRELAQNAEIVARFNQEAKVASKLRHPNVVEIFLWGRLPDGTVYLVMEFLDGVSLHSALQAEGGALHITRALHIALQICDAVGEAHAQGVIHRDVKPENIMLVRRSENDDFVKVLDFGIARITEKERSGLQTQAGLVFGTARYISPEGARGDRVHPQSDVYSIAIVLYQMLAGRTPFEGESSVPLLLSQINDVPPPLRSIPRANYVPPAIESVIMQNLAKSPSMRDADAHVFGRRLLDAAMSAGFSPDELLLRPALGRIVRPRPAVFGEGVRQSQSGIVPIITPPIEPRGSAVDWSTAHTPSAIPPAAHPPVPTTNYPPADRPTNSPPLTTAPSNAQNAATPQRTNSSATPLVVNTDLAQTNEPDEFSPLDERMRGAQGETDSVAPSPSRKRWPFFALVGVLLVGSGGAIAAYKLGYLGPQPQSVSKVRVDTLLAQLEEKAANKQFESMLPVAAELRSLAPKEARVLSAIRAASDRVVVEALNKKSHGDLDSSLHLFRIASKLSPDERGIQRELEEVEAEVASDPDKAHLVAHVAFDRYSANVRFGTNELLVAKQGDSTQLIATISDGPSAGTFLPKELDQKAHFRIKGPGIDKWAFVDAQAESATKYIANFIFKQIGSFTVYFFARPDRVPVKVTVEVRVTQNGKPPIGSPSTRPSGVPSVPTMTPTSFPVPKPTSKPSTTGTTQPTGTWPTAAPTPTPTSSTLTFDPVPIPVPHP